MDYKVSVVAGKRILSLSPHSTRFWTGDVVEGNETLSRALTLRDESELLFRDDPFELIRFKKALSEEGKDILSEIMSRQDVSYLLAPALFSSLVESGQLSSLPCRKIVAFNATAETQRSAPQDKIGSSRLTLIW